jgi:hypothetical protein
MLERASASQTCCAATVIGSPSQATRLSQRKLAAIDHQLQQPPGATLRGVAFTDATSTSTANVSIRRSRSGRSRRCQAWHPAPPAGLSAKDSSPIRHPSLAIHPVT